MEIKNSKGTAILATVKRNEGIDVLLTQSGLREGTLHEIIFEFVALRDWQVVGSTLFSPDVYPFSFLL